MAEENQETDAGQEPSMEDILASIRRVLAENDAPTEEIPDAEAAPEPASPPPPEPEPEPEFEPLDLGPELMVADQPAFVAPPTTPGPSPDSLLAPPTERASQISLTELARAVARERAVCVSDPSPMTLEELIRAMLRPMLKEWLDENLPYLIERLMKK